MIHGGGWCHTSVPSRDWLGRRDDSEGQAGTKLRHGTYRFAGNEKWTLGSCRATSRVGCCCYVAGSLHRHAISAQLTGVATESLQSQWAEIESLVMRVTGMPDDAWPRAHRVRAERAGPCEMMRGCAGFNDPFAKNYRGEFPWWVRSCRLGWWVPESCEMLACGERGSEEAEGVQTRLPVPQLH